MKKILLGIGTMTVVVTPVVVGVSCDNQPNVELQHHEVVISQQQKDYEFYINHSEYSSNFQDIAKKAIDWTDSSKPRVRSHAFDNTVIPSDFLLPETITSISDSAFVGASIPKDFKLSSLITTISGQAFAGAIFPEGYIIPDTVACISDLAFSNTTINGEFTIPDSVVKLGTGIFQAATINAKIVFPKGMTVLPTSSFESATINTNDFSLPDTLTTLDGNTFANTKLPSNFSLPSSLLALKRQDFYKAELPSGFNLPSTLETIGSLSFAYSTIPNGFVIPETVKVIGREAFKEAHLPWDFEIPLTTTVYPNSFEGASIELSPALNWYTYMMVREGGLTQQYISQFPGKDFSDKSKDMGNYTKVPQSLVGYAHIPANAFENTKIDFEIPSSITSIGDKAFSNAILPNGFTIPSTVEEVDYDAFENCLMEMQDGSLLPITTIRWEGHNPFNIQREQTNLDSVKNR